MLGFKAPLAYSSTFYFVCRKNGMERKYMMYEGEDVNTIDLLYEAPTDQPNGVKVIVPVKASDVNSFRKKIAEQLAYFENVYFNVEGIDNNFKIVRGEHFQYSEIASDKHLHICLDNVYYPVDFSKLGIGHINVGVGLRFSLTDGIFPTPNRESIRYTAEAKAIIINKIKNLADYFVNKYNESIKETEDFLSILNYYRKDERYVSIEDDQFNIKELLNLSNVKLTKPKMKGVDHLDLEYICSWNLRSYILGEYKSTHVVSSKSWKENKHYHDYVNKIENGNKFYIYSNRVSGLKKDYIKSLSKNRWDDFYIMKKETSFKLKSKTGNYDNYYKILQLKNHPKNKWRVLIQEFQKIINFLTDKFINIDELEVPQSFIDHRESLKPKTLKSSRGKKVKLEGDFSCKLATPLEKWVIGKNCKWVSEVVSINNFHRNKYILIYGTQEQAVKMDGLYNFVKSQKIKFATVSEREYAKLEKLELHNLISFSKFMEGKNKPFKRIVTAILIHMIKKENDNVFKQRSCLKEISTDLYEKIDSLYRYHNDNYEECSAVLANELIEHVEKNNLFDLSIYHTVKEVEKLCKDFYFLNRIMGEIRSWDSKQTDTFKRVLIDLFKYHRKKLNWELYKIKLNEDLKEEITSEEIQELVD